MLPEGSWVAVPDHAADQWRVRADVSKIGPRVGWFEADTVARPESDDLDEIRYHDEADVWLLRNQSMLVTVLDGEHRPDEIEDVTARVSDVADLPPELEGPVGTSPDRNIRDRDGGRT